MDLGSLPFIGILLSFGVLLVVLILVLLMRHRIKRSKNDLDKVIEDLKGSEKEFGESLEKLEKVREELDSLT